MIILLIFLVSLMTLYDYFNLKSSIDNEFANLQNQTEESITAALRLDDWPLLFWMTSSTSRC